MSKSVLNMSITIRDTKTNRSAEIPLRRSDDTQFVRLGDIAEFFNGATGLNKISDAPYTTLKQKPVYVGEPHLNHLHFHIFAPTEGWQSQEEYYVNYEPVIPTPVGLALSGGGFRAMLFHLGALQRLNELRVLSRIDTVSSVSGGSITNALLAVHWNDLRENDFSKEAFDVLIRRPLLKFSEYNFAARILFHPKEIFKRLFKTKSTATSLADAYINAEKEVKRAVKTELQGWKNSDPARYEKNKHLLPLLDKCGFHEHLSEVLPDPKKEQSPLFIFCGCDVRSGGPIYFTKLRVSQQLYRPSTPIEETKYDIPEREASRLTDEISLAEAVAASSAHPFFAQPLKIDYKRGPRKNLVLSVMDGGVVDNLGLDPLLLPNDYNKNYDDIPLPHMRVFISNAGAPVQEVDEPSVNIFNRLLRSLSLVGVQAERLRVRVLKENINTKRMYGAWWGLDDLWRFFYAHNFGRRNGPNGPAHGPDPSTDSGKVFGVPVAGNGQSSTKLASESTSESASDSDELATVQETTVRKSSELKGQKLADLANYLRSDTDFERIFTSTNPPHKMKDVLREVTTFRTDLNYINPEERAMLEAMGYLICAYNVKFYTSAVKNQLKWEDIEFDPDNRYNDLLNARKIHSAFRHSQSAFTSFFRNTWERLTHTH